MDNNNKTRKSIGNAIASLSYILVNGLLGLVFVKFVITYFGSDYNGINSSATQLVNILLVLEGGFTLATNVALFSPIKNNDFDSINSILSATRKRFIIIGLVFLIAGVAFSFIYALLIQTEVYYFNIVTLFLMSIIPNGINLLIAIKYKSLLLSNQKEYIISIFSLVTVLLGYVVSILLMCFHCGFWAIKIGPFAFSIINSLLIVFYSRKRYKFLKFNVKPDNESIKGTKDVFVSKLAGAAYSVIPIFVISVFFSNGSKLVSVYAVYVSIFSLISNAIMAFTSAPRFAFGALFSEGDEEKTRSKFIQYEFITFFVTTLLISTTIILISPFISIYTSNSDIDYKNDILPIILGSTFFISSIHIPSGHIINMSGHFKESKKINLISLISLILLTSIATLLSVLLKWNIYAVLICVSISAGILAIFEFYFAHTIVLKLNILKTIKVLLPSLLIFLASVFVSIGVPFSIENYFQFFLYGFLIFISLGLVTLLLNCFINFGQTKELFTILLLVFKKKK